MSTDTAGPLRQPDTAIEHADGERTVALIEGPVVCVLRLDAHGKVLGRVHVDTAPVPGELSTSMGAAVTLASPPAGTAQLRATAASVTLVVRTDANDVLVCRLAYAPGHGYRLLRRTRLRR